jgi:uncharacterized DUF497 family protein
MAKMDAVNGSELRLGRGQGGAERQEARSLDGRILVVVHREDDGIIRLISARRATRTEREQYEEEGE